MTLKELQRAARSMPACIRSVGDHRPSLSCRHCSIVCFLNLASLVSAPAGPPSVLLVAATTSATVPRLRSCSSISSGRRRAVWTNSTPAPSLRVPRRSSLGSLLDHRMSASITLFERGKSHSPFVSLFVQKMFQNRLRILNLSVDSSCSNCVVPCRLIVVRTEGALGTGVDAGLPAHTIALG